MGFFDDDPFEDIVSEFFGQNSSQRNNDVISGEQDERMIDFIETDKKVFLIFELPGYRKEDIKINVEKEKIEVNAKRKVGESAAHYLAQKLHRGVQLIKPLPKSLHKKKHIWTCKNGVLEIQFEK